jgi:hypothetical protein
MKVWESNKILTGMILICLIATVYIYYSNSPVYSSRLTEIQTKLLNSPELHQNGGDMPRYWIEFSSIEKRIFCLRDCGYKLVNPDIILSLKPGTSITFLVDSNDYNLGNNDLEIYALSVLNRDVYKLSDYNNCHINTWKRVLFFSLILFAILFYRLVKFIRTKSI